MRFIPFYFFLVVVQIVSAQQLSRTNIIPAPNSYQPMDGSFVFSSTTGIKLLLKDKAPAMFLTNYLKSNWNYQEKKGTGGTQIVIRDDRTENLPIEGYKLTVTPKLITIDGKGAGLFYAIQSLIQLFPTQKGTSAVLPCLKISDRPRFAYRGLMLDVSRHFFTVGEIKDLLDMMASYKLNRFHWHLTDDQGWRIEIKSFPKLTSVGAFRVPRQDFGGNPPQDGEKATEGGFYTQDQIRDVVKYAALRNIQVMPEIDVPGHSMAAIAAYPELSVTKDANAQVNPGSSFAKWFPNGEFEMHVDNTLNPTDEKVYDFLDKVFTEVASLFTYEYIHIGGDECYKGFWEKDPSVKSFMQRNNIASTQQLQAYFTKRVTEIIHTKKRKVIGWDEIDHDNLGGNVAIMNRFGEKGALSQTRRKVPIILAPGDQGLYFDYAQSRSDMEPVNHGGFSPLWKTYAYDADYGKLSREDRQYILGVQGCIWTEGMSSMRKVNYMILPRMLALAEGAWTDLKHKNYLQFASGPLAKHLAQFDLQGLNFRVPTALDYTDTLLIGSRFEIPLKFPFQGTKIYYTLNNRFPDIADHEYNTPISVDLLPGKKTILKTVVLTPSGKRSVITRTVMFNPVLRKAVSPIGVDRGLAYQLVDSGKLECRIDTGSTTDLSKLMMMMDRKGIALRLTGYFWVEKEAVFEFSSTRNDATLFVGELRLVEAGKTVADPLLLAKGYHKISIEYTSPGPSNLGIFQKTPGGSEKKEISWSALFH